MLLIAKQTRKEVKEVNTDEDYGRFDTTLNKFRVCMHKSIVPDISYHFCMKTKRRN